jgi:ribosomal protein S20
MPITNSAKKAERSSLRKKVFNLRKKAKIVNARKVINKLIKAETRSAEELNKALQAFYSSLDKAVKTKFIHRNKADRSKSRMAQRISNVLAGKTDMETVKADKLEANEEKKLVKEIKKTAKVAKTEETKEKVKAVKKEKVAE